MMTLRRSSKRRQPRRLPVLLATAFPFLVAARLAAPDTSPHLSARVAASDPPVCASPDPLPSQAGAPAPVDPAASEEAGSPALIGGPARAARWDEEEFEGAPLPRPVLNSHLEKSGRRLDYEQIGRRPERSAAYEAYCYPLAQAAVVSGYDLDKPNWAQRRGAMRMVGHGGVDLVVPKGTPITIVALDHQVGDAEVLYAGWLYGETVVTRHTLREGRGEHDYLLVFAHLERPAPVRRGAKLRAGDVVGYVGDTASANFPHLHLEARRVRDDIDPWSVLGWELHSRDVSVVTDPRNVLPPRDPDRPRRAGVGGCSS
jgi:murein DD-endopeptidase MepM/ murein hydrolase activator NlpD